MFYYEKKNMQSYLNGAYVIEIIAIYKIQDALKKILESNMNCETF